MFEEYRGERFNSAKVDKGRGVIGWGRGFEEGSWVEEGSEVG